MSAAVAYQVVRATGTALDQFKALAFHMDDMPVLRPGCDYRDGHLYMTFPIDADETRTVGRGKQAKEVTERVTTTLCLRSAGPDSPDPSLFRYDEEGVREEGYRFPQTFTQSLTNRWPMESFATFIGGEAKTEDPATLFRDLRAVYETHVEYPEDVYYDLVPLFVLGSYLFRLFPATGYIHFNGTAASGKSQNLRLLSAFGFNTVWASNMSSASLFRQVAGCPGVICVDEAESFESEKGQELRQILLAGYTDGSTVTRTEKGPNDRFVTIHYDAYAPKVLASINPLDPVLGSRCIVVPMQKAIRNIPDFDPADDRWMALRGRIYTWAYQHHAAVRAIRDRWFDTRATRAPELRSRAWEISQLYLILAEHVGGDALADRLVTFFTEYFAKTAKAREDGDRQYTLLKCLPRVIATTSPHPGLYYAIKDIHAVASSYLEEDAREYYKTRTVSRHLTTLGFRERQSAKGGAQVRLLEAEIRRAFTRHHITPYPEDEAWATGTTDYQDPTTAPRPAPTPMPLPPTENLDWLAQYLNEDQDA